MVNLLKKISVSRELNEVDLSLLSVLITLISLAWKKRLKLRHEEKKLRLFSDESDVC